MTTPADQTELRDSIAPTDRSTALREQLLHALDSSYVIGPLGWDSVEDLLDAYDTSRAPATDQAAVLREAIDLAREEGHRLEEEVGTEAARGARCVAYLLRRRLAKEQPLRRLADETPDTTPQPAEDPARIDRLRPEFAEHASVESIDAQLDRARRQERRWHLRIEWLTRLRTTRVAQKERGEWPAAGARQDEVWPVQESTRRYAEELRATPGQASADGHAGWECDAGAQLLISASTPGPGALGTHHGTVYACRAHRGAALQRITGSGYQADPRPAPSGHRWNPWPCGHVTAHDSAALTALTAAGVRQDGAQP